MYNVGVLFVHANKVDIFVVLLFLSQEVCARHCDLLLLTLRLYYRFLWALERL